MMQHPACPRCRAPLTAATPFCAQCGQPLAPMAQAPQPIAHPAMLAGSAPLAPYVPPAMGAPLPYAAPLATGPSWPYPEPATRKTSSFETMFGVAFIGAGVFSAFIGVVTVGAGGPDFGAILMLALFVIGFPLLGILSLRAGIKNKRTAAELTQNGIRCWGRVTSVRMGKTSRAVNRHRWYELFIEVEAFAAVDARAPNGYRQQPAGSKIAERVELHWFVSAFQMGLLQPGSFCAFLLHPSDPKKHYLDALVTPEGHPVALM